MLHTQAELPLSNPYYYFVLFYRTACSSVEAGRTARTTQSIIDHRVEILGDVAAVAIVNSYRALNEATFPSSSRNSTPVRLTIPVSAFFTQFMNSLTALASSAIKTRAPRTAAPIRLFSILICIQMVDGFTDPRDEARS